MSDIFNPDPNPADPEPLTPLGPEPGKNGKPKRTKQKVSKPMALRLGVEVNVAPIPGHSPRTHIDTCLSRRQSLAILSLRYSMTGDHVVNRQGKVVDSTNATIRHLIDILADQLGIPED